MQLTNIDPMVQMGTLEELLTGKPVTEIIETGTGRDIAVRDNGERIVMRLTDELRTALAASAEERLRQVATPWSKTEEFWGDGDAAELADVLLALAALARKGVAENLRMYCWVCV